MKFRPDDEPETIKYSPSEILGFKTGKFIFKSLFNIDLYAENYPLLGKTSLLKQSFGQVVHQGKINIYFILYHGVDPISGAAVFHNIVFEKVSDGRKEYAAYPTVMRMRDKKYEKAKENLYQFFSDYPEIIEKIKQYKQQNDFFEVVESVKQIK